MRDFDQPKVPVWRLALYGLAALGVACWIGARQGSSGLVIGAAAAIPLLMLCLLGIARFARSPLLPRYLPLLFVIYALGQLALFCWDMFLRH